MYENKYEKWNKICDLCANGHTESGADNVIIADISILGDTVDELSRNINKFFSSGGRIIQCTDGIRIEKTTPRLVV